MISTVVFDFDGTLVDSNAVKRQGFFDSVAAHVGGRERMKTILGATQGDRRTIFTAYLAYARQNGLCVDESVDELVTTYGHAVDAAVMASKAMPGASEILHELHERGRKLYLSSATPLRNLIPIIEARGWLGFFAGVFGRPADKIESIRTIWGETGSSSDTMAVIGDGIDDRDSAEAIGCTFFPVGNATATIGAEQVFTLPEILEILLHRPN